MYASSTRYSSSRPATSSSSNSGILAVRVPANAKVYVNGSLTSTPGDYRRFVSRNLEPGRDYRYQVRAEAEIDGKIVERTRQVTLRAGSTEELTFSFDGEDQKELVTSLTLNVPTDAKVYLSGNETEATGAERVFQTKRLSAGETWGEYVVRVELQRNGKTLTQEREVSISGGDQKQLSFDFAEQLASLAAR
jgi:uncharacterized protein (TIGR03000 family)